MAVGWEVTEGNLRFPSVRSPDRGCGRIHRPLGLIAAGILTWRQDDANARGLKMDPGLRQDDASATGLASLFGGYGGGLLRRRDRLDAAPELVIAALVIREALPQLFFFLLLRLYSRLEPLFVRGRFGELVSHRGRQRLLGF